MITKSNCRSGAFVLIAFVLLSTPLARAAVCSSNCDYVLNVSCGARPSCTLSITTDGSSPVPVRDIEVAMNIPVQMKLNGSGQFAIGFRPKQAANVFPVFLFTGDSATPFQKTSQGVVGHDIEAKYFIFWWDDATNKHGFYDPRVIVNGGTHKDKNKRKYPRSAPIAP